MSVRDRGRIRVFDRVEMRSRRVGDGDRLLGVEQVTWKGETGTTQALIRGAITSSDGIVPPARVPAASGEDPDPPPLPGRVAARIAAEAERPWPPDR